jgi:hypothetical protein
MSVTPRDSGLGSGRPPGMPSTGPSGPAGQSRAEEPPVLLQLQYVRPGAHREPVEFAVRPPEPAVRIVGVPDPSSIPPEVMRCLDDLARACREAYGLGVEVEGGGEREAALLALETLRRYLG